MSEPTPVPDIHDGPLSDLGHESLRLSVVAALDDLEAKTTQMSGVLRLTRVAFDFAETFLKSVTPLQQAVTDQGATLAALQQTVAALLAVNPRAVADGVTTSAGTTVTSASAQFSVTDQGRPIAASTLPDGTTITTVIDAATVTVSQPATADSTGLTLTIG